MQEGLYWLSATELLRHYRRRELSPVEVIRTLFARIERLEPQLNAFVLLDAEAALGAARESEAQRYDLLLTPTTAWTAPALDTQKPQPSSPFTFPFSLTRQPAISVPAGFSRAGLPIGIQIVGRHFDDALVLAAAYALDVRAPFPRLGELG